MLKSPCYTKLAQQSCNFKKIPSYLTLPEKLSKNLLLHTLQKAVSCFLPFFLPLFWTLKLAFQCHKLSPSISVITYPLTTYLYRSVHQLKTCIRRTRSVFGRIVLTLVFSHWVSRNTLAESGTKKNINTWWYWAWKCLTPRLLPLKSTFSQLTLLSSLHNSSKGHRV